MAVLQQVLSPFWVSATVFIFSLLLLTLFEAEAVAPDLVIIDQPIVATDSVNVVATEEGRASFYGSAFEGRPTASGELFDPDELTAAHPSLPMDTRVRVTNLRNDRAVILRINDRGPFVRTRIIDVSKRAAEKLDMVDDGHVPVQVEVIE